MTKKPERKPGKILRTIGLFLFLLGVITGVSACGTKEKSVETTSGPGVETEAKGEKDGTDGTDGTNGTEGTDGTNKGDLAEGANSETTGVDEIDEKNDSLATATHASKLVSLGDAELDREIKKLAVKSGALAGESSRSEQFYLMYETLLKKSDYLGVGTPDLKEGWEVATATEFLKSGKGNCYSYGSAVGMIAQALGIRAKVRVGQAKWKKRFYEEHCWVLIEDSWIVDGLFSDLSGKDPTHFFMVTRKDIEKTEKCEYII